MFSRTTITMVLCLVTVSLTAGTAAAQAQLIKGLRYTYDVEPNSTPDENHTALTDGKPGNVGWYRKSTVMIDFDLGSTYTVTRVEVDASRDGFRSRLRNLQLFVDEGAGHTLVGKMTDAAGADYFITLVDELSPDIAPLRLRSPVPLTFTFEDVDRKCTQLRLVLTDSYSTGPHWAITEVRIYGIPITEQVASKAASAEEQVAALKPYSLPDTRGELVFQEGNFDADSEAELLLSNQYVTMVIEPSLGGVIGNFAYQGVEFTQPKNPKAPGGGGGFLSDHVTSQPVDGDWFDVPYKYTVTEKSADLISVKLSGTGKTGSLQYLTFNKTITLWKDRSNVRVDYEIVLDEKATVTLPFNFWFHNYAGTRKGTQKSKTLTFFVPEDTGIQKLDWSTQKRSDVGFNHPARGWAGLADTDKHAGLVFGFDYRQLMNVSSWGSKGLNALPTLEWRFSEILIPDGDSFSTSFTITPFQGLDKISGAGPSMVGAINYEKVSDLHSRITATVVSAATQKASALLRYRVLPVGSWQTILDTDVSLQVDTPLSIAADVKVATVGTHVFSLIIAADGKELLDLEEPVSIGTPKNDYVLRPKVKRARVKSTKVNVQYISTDYETPHVKWARPYTRGKTKALILVDGRYQREVIELAQRMDLDFDSTYLFPVSVFESISDYYGKTMPVDLEAGLNRLLSENPDWEVLVMAGHMFRYFTQRQREHVMERVKEGAGLVVVQPDMTYPLPELSPLLDKGESRRIGQWTKSADHFITTGIPWKALPDVAAWYQYKVATGADVLATVKGDPLLAVREYGKGRVVALSYRSGDSRITKENVGSFFGLTPFMTSYNGTDYIPYPTFKYYEYHFSLLAKSVLWAAKKEPSVLVDKIEATAGKVTLNLNFLGEDLKAFLDMTVTDKYGNTLAKTEPMSLQPAAGKRVVDVPVPVALGSGINLLDIFVRDEEGRVINWATASLDVVPPVRIMKITDDMARARAAKEPPPVYRPGSTINLDIPLGGESATGLSLAVSTIDGFGRVTAKKTIPVTSNPVKTSFTIENPRSMLLTVHAELTRDGRTIDIHEIRVPVELPLPVKPHEGEPTLLGWSFPSSYGMNNYLIPSYFKLLSEMGFNGILVSGRNATPTALQSAWRNNMVLQSRVAGISEGGSLEGRKLQRPKRNPTLLNPEHLSTTMASVSGIRNTPNVFAIQADDEASYSPSLDFDYSTESLAGMREWLKTEYADLTALNEQWNAKFQSWDEVTPLTLKETKARGDDNYSSWCDHRTWGEMVVARFYDIMGNAATEAKPGTFHGPSGNPGVGVYGGYDFWQLSKTLTGLWAYGGSDELSLWSRDKTKILKYSSFGGVNNQRVRNYGTLFTGTSGTAVCGTQRVPAFDWTDSRAGAGYRAAWVPLKRGIGRAIHEATRTPDSICVHYSRNASRIAYILGFTGVWRETRWKIRRLFEGCGFDHDWISYEHIENGETRGAKLIFLPMSFTLSDKEVAGLETFVNNGGIIVAGPGTGIADSHGKMLKQGRLDHLLGIQRQDSRIRLRKDAAVSTGTPLGLRFPEMPFDYIESGLKPAGAKVLAVAKQSKLPIAFANEVGDGLAVYIACNLPTSYFMINAARGVGGNAKYAAEAEDFITALATRAGVVPRLRIEAVDAGRIPFARTVMFTQGDVRYFGILRNHGLAKDFASEPVEVDITFPAKGYVHELLSRKEYGLTDSVETILKPTTLLLYSWVPYPVDGVDLALSKKIAAPGNVISYEVTLKSDAAMSTHTLHMGVFDPDGEESKPYSHNITAPEGKAKGVIPLALNDKAGPWTLRVTDIVSGAKGSATFTVK